jgi:predicted Rossmann-fold nucleotide-binding protein
MTAIDNPPCIAVFASDRGPGDPERASIMTQVGKQLAERRAHMVCLAEGVTAPVPLITGARRAGGRITLVADESFRPPVAFDGIPIERLADGEARLRRLADLADLMVALPGSLASSSNLYLSWVRGAAGAVRKPLVFYNRNGAFEVIRGFAADVLAHSIPHHDRGVQFADSPEDLWNKIGWVLAERAAHPPVAIASASAE